MAICRKEQKRRQRKNQLRRIVLEASSEATPWPDVANWTFQSVIETSDDLWGGRWNDDGTVLYWSTTTSVPNHYNTTPSAFSTPYVPENITAFDTPDGQLLDSGRRSWDWHSDGRGLIAVEFDVAQLTSQDLASGATAYNPTATASEGYTGALTTHAISAAMRTVHVCNEGTVLCCADQTNQDLYQFDLSVANDITSETENATVITGSYNAWSWDPTGLSGYVLTRGGTEVIYKFTATTAWDPSTISIDTGSSIAVGAQKVASDQTTDFVVSPDGTSLLVFCWDAAASDEIQYWSAS